MAEGGGVWAVAKQAKTKLTRQRSGKTIKFARFRDSHHSAHGTPAIPFDHVQMGGFDGSASAGMFGSAVSSSGFIRVAKRGRIASFSSTAICFAAIINFECQALAARDGSRPMD
jgi:hypothetical protein